MIAECHCPMDVETRQVGFNPRCPLHGDADSAPANPMSTYRTGNHWGVTIVRTGVEPIEMGHRADDQLVAVVVNGDQALAERICTLLNASDQALLDSDGHCDVPTAHRHGRDTGPTGPVCICAPGALPMHGPPYTPPDSCTCPLPHAADPACPVHEGRKARGPKRHGVVL